MVASVQQAYDSSMNRPDNNSNGLVLSVDPVAFIRKVEKIWQARDGAMAVA